MPRSGQIIPSWLHPHEATYINDNTRYEDYAENNMGPVFLNVFMSSKGVDNKLKYYNNITEWVREYGLPDYRRYGQPGYNAYVSLSTGLACSQSMRIMPKDAAYANAILIAKYKKLNNKLALKFEVKSQVFLTDIDELDNIANSYESNVPDENGFLTLPIMYFWSRGRGLYGNNYRVRISRDKGSDKDNDYVNYVIELLSTEDGALSSLEAYGVSFYIDALDPNNNTTLFINDLIDDENNKGSGRFNCQVIYDNLERIFEKYKEIYEEAVNTHVTPTVVDVLPPVAKPSTTSLYVVNDTDVKVYNRDTDAFIDYAKGSVIESVIVNPCVVPTAPVPGVNYLIKANDLVFKYNDTIEACNATVHEINEVAEIAYVAGDIYKVVNSADTANNGYYLASSTTDAARINAIECPSSVITVGAVVAIEGIMYHNTTADTYCVLDAGTINDVTSNVIEVTELPSLNLAVVNTVYKVSSTGIMYILVPGATSFAVYTDPADDPEELVYTMETWDIFGYNKFTGKQDEYFNFVDGLNSVAILSTEGQVMRNGHDGSFSDVGSQVYYYQTNPETGALELKQKALTSSARDEAIEQAYLTAFQGGFDNAIASKRRAPVDIMLDANYPLSVKKAMVALAQNRFDAACHIDSNLINNIADLETFYTNISDLSSYIISFDAHMFKTTDPITGKVIPVTITLWLASKYPQHYNVYGNHTPLAGEEYATLSGYQRNSIRPIVDADDHETKELMYDTFHMNYVECVAENVYMRGTQETSQGYWSDLSEENNVLVLLEIKRKIERLAATNRFKWSDNDELVNFKESCQEIFSSYAGTKCKTLDIDVQSNSWEKTRYITHVYLAVVFRTFQKRAIIEIDVNPRA